MKHLHFDLIGGASGDMVLGVFADMGTDMNELSEKLDSLGIGKVELAVKRDTDHGIAGTRVTVKINGREAHNHNEHHHRRLGDIKKILGQSELPDEVKEKSVFVFERLAAAEASVHGVAVEKIHFHEVGAADSILDIAGACLCLFTAGINTVSTGAFPMGTGTTTCAHGILPLPVPAVIKLLKGLIVRSTREPFELVTPTGAALLGEWKNLETAPDACRITNSGYGLGHRKLKGLPNALRGVEMERVAEQGSDSCYVLECNIDDMQPELVSSLMDSLFEKGALDVFVTPVQMKKQRPGFLLTVICDESFKAGLSDTIFMESTTFGVRGCRTERVILDRRNASVNTPYGDIRIKIGTLRGDDITFAPEYDDCVSRARAASVPVRTVYESAVVAASSLKE